MLRWKLSAGCGEEGCGWVRGGRKCEGAAERVVHDGSGVVASGEPLRRELASVRDWERRRSWAARNWAEVEPFGWLDGDGPVAGSEGYE
jgi:hypothetical protein